MMTPTGVEPGLRLAVLRQPTMYIGFNCRAQVKAITRSRVKNLIQIGDLATHAGILYITLFSSHRERVAGSVHFSIDHQKLGNYTSHGFEGEFFRPRFTLTLRSLLL